MALIDFSKDRRRMLACADGVVRVWETDKSNGECFGSGCVAAKWSPFGLSIASCHEDGSVQFWVLQSSKWQSISTVRRGRGKCTDLAFGPGHLGAWLVVSKEDGTVLVFRGGVLGDEAWALSAKLACDDEAAATCVSWHHHDLALCVGTASGSVKFWRRREDDEWVSDSSRTFEAGRAVLDVSWHDHVAVATSEKVILIPDIVVCREPATRVEWNDTGRILAVGSAKGCQVYKKQDFTRNTKWVLVDSCVQPPTTLSLAPPPNTPFFQVKKNTTPQTPFAALSTTSSRLEAPPSFSFAYPPTPLAYNN